MEIPIEVVEKNRSAVGILVGKRLGPLWFCVAYVATLLPVVALANPPEGPLSESDEPPV